MYVPSCFQSLRLLFVADSVGLSDAAAGAGGRRARQLQSRVRHDLGLPLGALLVLLQPVFPAQRIKSVVCAL